MTSVGNGHGLPRGSAHPSAAFEVSGLPGSRFGYFVQFPHPGNEHHPAGQAMGWHRGRTHGRKFMLCRGRYAGADGVAVDGEVVFWGEWEPPSEIVARWEPSGDLPRALHRPYWITPGDDGFRQNTDPWVFGERMILSNCRQVARGRPSAVQQLTRGSVVCFGSTIGGVFCADTVMVIASAETWVPGAGADLGAGEAFRVCAAESLSCGGGRLPGRLTLYRGATIDDPVNGMYSFVPALTAARPYPRFARPGVELSELNQLIRPGRQSPWRSHSMPPGELHAKWDAIRCEVLAAGLVLGVSLDTPPRRNSARGEDHDHRALPMAGQARGGMAV